jgi:putative photosynthetic complex assembly protein
MSQTRSHRYHAQADEMIPTVLLRLMFALVLSVLALVTVATLSGRPLESTPDFANEVIRERAIYLSGDTSGAARVLDQNGAVLAVFDAETGGFIAGIERVIHRERMKHGITENGPVLLQLRDGNRLSITDPSTDWSAELMGFGVTNIRSFARLLDQP